MNDRTLIQILTGVVIVAVIFLLRRDHSRLARCPGCQRFGRISGAGRYCCSACDATFQLDKYCRPAPNLRPAILGPLVLLIFAAFCCVVACVWYATPEAIWISGVVVLAAAFHLWRTLRRQVFIARRLTDG